MVRLNLWKSSGWIRPGLLNGAASYQRITRIILKMDAICTSRLLSIDSGVAFQRTRITYEYL